MKTLIKNRKELQQANRWDIDFHLPAEGVARFPREILKRVDQVADVAKNKRDPGKSTESTFLYLDISSVDVMSGSILSPQEVDCSDAPSRARKVVRAFDLMISTCRPTRGAIAVVPPKLHDQIASTGFSIIRAKRGINPFYLHFALRLPSTLEQFRKWSTGSSYPAILDEDVAKTLIPVPSPEEQDEIAKLVVQALEVREATVHSANVVWNRTLDEITSRLSGAPISAHIDEEIDTTPIPHTIEEIEILLRSLPPLTSDRTVARDIQTELSVL
ncbi:hypothetical protein [Pseudomonas putida]|uniref:hypothetical protein n=1 Tax=Pseudomonas putida TaxID=303 RepID=UPI000B1B8584|nr:hypothetical protein [Pseudomonas putida]